MMRGTAIVAVMLVLLASFDSAASAQERTGGPPAGLGAPRGTASIAGRIITPASNTPVRAADIEAMSENGMRLVTKSDENGAYRFDGVSEGAWRINASKGGYVSWQFGQRRPFQPPPPISLARGQAFTADIPLSRGGAISGRVYDASGDALAGLQVRVYRATMQQGARRLEAVGVADLTDDSGAYRVYGLPPGDYYVAASLRVAPLDSIVETTYGPTYFPGTGDLAEAQRIKLGLGAEAAATFPLLPVRNTRVSGIVLNSSGAPADAFLSLVSERSELGVPVGGGGVTRQDGTFTLADVSPGRYLLKASLRGETVDESGSTPVTVDAEDVSGITVVTGRPAAVRGTIVADTGVANPLPRGLSVIAFSSRETGSVLDGDEGPAFEVGSLTGPFRLAVEGLPGEWAVKEIRVDDVDALDTPVELAPGQRAVARVVLTTRLTEVSGAVAPVEANSPASVIVFPENSEKWGHRSRYVRAVQADARGNFRIAGLPAGEQYLAFATDYLEDGEHLDPEFLTSIRSAAVPFSLEEAEKRTLDLKVVER